MQLSYVNLEENRLEGTLPQSWNNLTGVGQCYQSVNFVTDDSSVLQFYIGVHMLGVFLYIMSAKPHATLDLLECCCSQRNHPLDCKCDSHSLHVS